MAGWEEENALWTVRSDNYNNYVLAEMNTGRRVLWLEKILSQVPSQRGGCPQKLMVLDAGCGPGFFSVLLSSAGHEVYGVDGSEGMLAHARENAQHFGCTPHFLTMDATRTTFPDETFDLVVSRNVTHIFQDHAGAYREWKRVLKRGGVLLIFDANWHLPYVEGEIRERAIRAERMTLEKYGSNFCCEAEKYEYIDSELNPEHYKTLGSKIRPDYDLEILKDAGFAEISADRDITEKLWSEKEKFMYAQTPLFMIRAVRGT